MPGVLPPPGSTAGPLLLCSLPAALTTHAQHMRIPLACIILDVLRFALKRSRSLYCRWTIQFFQVYSSNFTLVRIIDSLSEAQNRFKEPVELVVELAGVSKSMLIRIFITMLFHRFVPLTGLSDVQKDVNPA